LEGVTHPGQEGGPEGQGGGRTGGEGSIRWTPFRSHKLAACGLKGASSTTSWQLVATKRLTGAETLWDRDPRPPASYPIRGRNRARADTVPFGTFRDPAPLGRSGDRRASFGIGLAGPPAWPPGIGLAGTGPRNRWDRPSVGVRELGGRASGSGEPPITAGPQAFGPAAPPAAGPVRGRPPRSGPNGGLWQPVQMASSVRSASSSSFPRALVP